MCMMHRKTSSLIVLLTHLVDGLFLLLAYLFSFWFRFYSDIFDVSKGIPLFSDYLQSLFLLVVVYFFVFHFFHLYTKEQITEEYYTLFKSTFFVLFVFTTFTFVQREVSYSRLFIAISFFSSFIFVSVGRFILNNFKRMLYAHGYLLTRTLLISDEKNITSLSQNITKTAGYQLVKTVTLSSLRSLETMVRDLAIDEIIIHLPKEQQSKILDIMHRAGYHVTYTLIPNYTDILTKRALPSNIGGLSVLRLETTSLQGFSLFIKHLFDFLFSLLFLILFSPVFLLIAICIKLNSPHGPIFYTQERVSYNYRPFLLYKFRTMIPNAEQQTGPKWADDHDPRVFFFGKFLRRTNLDELPQLFNVLKGDMSLVGPRPERPFFIHQFKNNIPHYLERHAVKGGMTGWAQVNGYYGNTSLEERIKHDIFYLENWSLLFDIKILLRTIRLIFFRK